MLDERAKYWLPVDQYVGGVEHAVLHLLYSRFFYRCLRDMGMVEESEPFTNLLCQGMVLKDGFKMSKSKGNTIDPNDLVKKYGADSLRLFVMFAAPPDQSFEWSDKGIQGSHRFLKRIWNLVYNHIDAGLKFKQSFNTKNKNVLALRNKTHRTLSKVKDDYKRRHSFNTAIASIMELSNSIPKEFLSKESDIYERSSAEEAIKYILIMLSPITPHITHFLWKEMGSKKAIIDVNWPNTIDELLVKETLELAIQINGKLRTTLKVRSEDNEDEILKIVAKDKKIENYIKGKKITRHIYVEGKLVNLVVK